MAEDGGPIQFVFQACFTGLTTAGVIFFARRGLRSRVRADGRMVRVFERRESDGSPYRNIALAFRDGSQEHAVERLDDSWWWARPREGQAVRVYFPPGRPDQATLNPWGGALWTLPLAVGGWFVVGAKAGWW